MENPERVVAWKPKEKNVSKRKKRKCPTPQENEVRGKTEKGALDLAARSLVGVKADQRELRGRASL